MIDIRRIFAVRTTRRVVGLDTSTPSDTNLYGESFAYVILQIANYKKTDAACNRSPTTTDSGLCFSGVTVNRSASPVSLILRPRAGFTRRCRARRGVAE